MVAMATYLRPSISARICLHWLAGPRKPTPRIKQRVSYSRSYIDSKFTCSTPYTKVTTDFRGGWWDPTMLGIDVLT